MSDHNYLNIIFMLIEPERGAFGMNKLLQSLWKFGDLYQSLSLQQHWLRNIIQTDSLGQTELWPQFIMLSLNNSIETVQ